MNFADPGLGNSGAYGSLQVAWEVVRQVLVLLLCGLTTGLVLVGMCWGCGYGAYAAWTRVGPIRHPLDDPLEPDDPLEAEAARGIAEIEQYLSSRCQPPGSPDTTANEPGRPSPPAESQ